jgi:hypothetical protein
MNFLDPMIHDALVKCAPPVCMIGVLVFLIIWVAYADHNERDPR